MSESGDSARLPGTWPQTLRRVIFYGPRFPDMGGGSTAVENLADALSRYGIEVELISHTPGTSRALRHPVRLVLAHPEWHRGPVLRGGRSLSAMTKAVPVLLLKRQEILLAHRRIRRLMESYGPETAVVFTHEMTKRFLDDSGYRSTADGPLFIGQHHEQFASLETQVGVREFIATHFRDADAFTALSDDDAREFSSLLPIPCFGIGNPVPAEWTILQESRRRMAVALARFSHEKQLDLMVRAFASATTEPPLTDWTLQIYGSGDQELQIRQAIAATGSENRVRLMGPTDHPERIYPKAMLTLSSSSFEGFGLTILEAATCGTPSLAFDCSPGVHGLIPPDSGFLVRPLTEEAYTKALKDALSDPDRLGRMGQAARRHAERFSPEHVVEQWGRILSVAQRRHADRFVSAS